MIPKLSLPGILVLLVAATTLASCQRVEPVTEMPEPLDHAEAARTLPFTVVTDGNHGPVEPGEYVFRDAQEWRAVREGLRDLAYDPALATEGVLLASVHANTGGFSLRFDTVYVSAGEVTAAYTVHEPGPECMVTMALTQPFQVIAVPGLPEGPVVFVQRRQTYPC